MKEGAVVIFLALATFAQAQDTLKHFDPAVSVPVADEYANNEGYFTGHNDYGDEEFAEKYETANGNILGVLAIHKGAAGTSTMNASYKVYEVGSNGLPGTEKVSKSVPYNNFPVSQSAVVTMFDNPVPVSGQFFISFGLGDYSHGNPGTKRIALTHSAEGTRPLSDSAYGRTAIRWHSHSGIVWKDYRTENSQSAQPWVYFSLFPIVQLDNTTSVINATNQSMVLSVYPNPSQGSFVIPVNSKVDEDAAFQLYDVKGQLVAEKQFRVGAGVTNVPFVAENVQSGTYFLLSNIASSPTAQKVVIE